MMAKTFSVSAIFKATDQFTAPLKAISGAVKGFKNDLKSASSSETASFNQIGTSADHARTKLNNLNNVKFGALQLRIRDLRNNINGLSKGINNAGNRSLMISAATIASAWGLSKTLDPVREAQNNRIRLGSLYNVQGTPEQKDATGKYHEGIINSVAKVLPGADNDYVRLAATLKNYGVDYTKKMLTNLADIAIGSGFGDVNREFSDSFNAMISGRQSMLDDAIGLHAGNKGGKTSLTDSATGKEYAFENKSDLMAFLQKWSIKKGYTGMADSIATKTIGKEATSLSNIQSTFKTLWEDTGALSLYNSLLDTFNENIDAIKSTLSGIIKPFAEFGNQNKKLTLGLLIGVPALALFGGGLKLLAFGLLTFSPLLVGAERLLALFTRGSKAATVANAALAVSQVKVNKSLKNSIPASSGLSQSIKVLPVVPAKSVLSRLLGGTRKLLFSKLFLALPVIYEIGKHRDGILKAFGSIKATVSSLWSQYVTNIPFKKIDIKSAMPNFTEIGTTILKGFQTVGDVLIGIGKLVFEIPFADMTIFVIKAVGELVIGIFNAFKSAPWGMIGGFLKDTALILGNNFLEGLRATFSNIGATIGSYLPSIPQANGMRLPDYKPQTIDQSQQRPLSKSAGETARAGLAPVINIQNHIDTRVNQAGQSQTTTRTESQGARVVSRTGKSTKTGRY